MTFVVSSPFSQIKTGKHRAILPNHSFHPNPPLLPFTLHSHNDPLPITAGGIPMSLEGETEARLHLVEVGPAGAMVPP